MAFRKLLERFRRPEYTGSNRCVPCTVLNAAVAMVLALGVGVFALYAAGGVAALLAGTLIAVLSGAAIYLRGYLVPGTPWLTKTYGPDWLLERFGKQTTGVDDGADIDLALKGVGATSSTDAERHQADGNRTTPSVDDHCSSVDDCSSSVGDRSSSSDDGSSRNKTGENNTNSDETDE